MIKKHLMIVIFFIIFLLSFINGEEINYYKMYLIKTFEEGEKAGQLGYNPFFVTGVPRGIGFDNSYNFYIADDGNNRVNIYNNDFNFIKMYNIERLANTLKIEQDKSNIVFRGMQDEIVICNFELKILAAINFYPIKKLLNITLQFTNDYFILYKNIIFTYTSDHQLISIQNPSTDQEENKENYRGHEETRKLIKSKYKELTIDDKDRIILDGKIMTRIYNDYIAYWKEQNKDKTPPKHALSYDIIQSVRNLDYFGKDKDNNWYWGIKGVQDSEVIVFNDSGWLIEYFILKDFDKWAYPAINPRGDIFYLDLYWGKGEKVNKLYMVTRVWGYDIKPGKCKEDKVRIRVLPGLKFDVIGQLNKDEEIEILTKTYEKEKVEQWENYWYKIRKKDGTVGWVFGEFIKYTDNK